MFHLLLCKCFDKLLKQDDKGDVSNRDNGSCPGKYLSWIGSADHLGPWFDALLVQWCFVKYVDHIALPFVFSMPAEVGARQCRNQLPMLRLYLCKGFNNMLEQEDKGDVSAETTGPAPAEVSDGTQISAERLAVLLAYP
ncbi:hypothetical protein V6N12_065767 [Hibiscus sabdariffa]|uniref:Uncharacterized protein n=1 Tax=Hibiscus sabdariffa TaxID=183260 RepID=A0ABR2G9N8_9ROSI